MSKQPNIRWRSNDVEQIERAIKNFNAKIYRTKRNHPELIDYLPNTIKKGDVINSIKTRADFNRTIKSLQRFSKRGAEKPVENSAGVKTTQWAVNEFNIKKAVVNRKRKKLRAEIDNTDVKIGGKSTGQKRASMNDVHENKLEPYTHDFETRKSQKEWEKAQRAIDKQVNQTYLTEKQELMRENYIKGLRENNYLSGEDAEEIEKYIRGVDVETFYINAETDDTATFQFYKDPESFEVKKEYIKNTWKSLYEEQHKS